MSKEEKVETITKTFRIPSNLVERLAACSVANDISMNKLAIISLYHTCEILENDSSSVSQLLDIKKDSQKISK
jgi:hypothetical protein